MKMRLLSQEAEERMENESLKAEVCEDRTFEMSCTRLNGKSPTLSAKDG